MAGASPDEDPYADEPDRWDEADREWDAKWSDDESAGQAGEPDETAGPPLADYRPRKVTARGVHDAYGEGMREAGPHLGLGVQIAGAMLLFVGLGLVVDRWLDTTPWGVIVGAALGMVGILTLVIRVSNEARNK